MGIDASKKLKNKKIKAFDRLEGRWLYWAGRYWHGITDEMKSFAKNKS